MTMRRFFFKVPVTLYFTIDAPTPEKAVEKAEHALAWIDENDPFTDPFDYHEAGSLTLGQSGTSSGDIIDTIDLNDVPDPDDEFEIIVTCPRHSMNHVLDTTCPACVAETGGE